MFFRGFNTRYRKKRKKNGAFNFEFSHLILFLEFESMSVVCNFRTVARSVYLRVMAFFFLRVQLTYYDARLLEQLKLFACERLWKEAMVFTPFFTAVIALTNVFRSYFKSDNRWVEKYYRKDLWSLLITEWQLPDPHASDSVSSCRSMRSHRLVYPPKAHFW